jgi:hypothetical protein
MRATIAIVTTVALITIGLGLTPNTAAELADAPIVVSYTLQSIEGVPRGK